MLRLNSLPPISTAKFVAWVQHTSRNEVHLHKALHQVTNARACRGQGGLADLQASKAGVQAVYHDLSCCADGTVDILQVCHRPDVHACLQIGQRVVSE